MRDGWPLAIDHWHLGIHSDMTIDQR